MQYMATSDLVILAPLITLIFTIINFILTYNINRYFNFIKIIEKSNLITKILDTKLFIKNEGGYPINNIDVYFHFFDVINVYNLGKMHYNINNTLNLNEEINIDFDNNLKNLLVEKNRMVKRMVNMPIGKHPMDDELIFGDIPIYHININLDIIVTIKIIYSIFNEKYEINKKYGFQYIIKERYYYDGLYYDYENNYDLNIVLLPGIWKDVD